MSCNYSSTIVAVIVVLFKFRKLQKACFSTVGWRTVEFPNETVVRFQESSSSAGEDD
jgi:hypothetical protein